MNGEPTPPLTKDEVMPPIEQHCRRDPGHVWFVPYVEWVSSKVPLPLPCPICLRERVTAVICERCRTTNAGPGRCGGCGRWLGPRPLHDYSKKELARRG